MTSASTEILTSSSKMIVPCKISDFFEFFGFTTFEHRKGKLYHDTQNEK